MKHVDVDSDVIHFIGYNKDTRTLDVRLHETGIYHYYDVEPDAVQEFLDADAKGQYFKEYRSGALPLVTWTASEVRALAAARFRGTRAEAATEHRCAAYEWDSHSKTSSLPT